jgi:hypothetical protein
VPDDIVDGTLVRLVLPDGERVPAPALVSQLTAAGAYIAKIDARPAQVQRSAAEVLAVEVSELDGLRAWLDKNGVDPDTWGDLLAGAQELLDADQVAVIDSTE